MWARLLTGEAGHDKMSSSLRKKDLTAMKLYTAQYNSVFTYYYFTNYNGIK